MANHYDLESERNSLEIPGFWRVAFFTVGKRSSSRIKSVTKNQLRGFGSIRVQAQIGKTKWRTSMFPTKEGTYLLPIKAGVRREEAVDVGDSIIVRLTF
jgi:hypothetical protein